MLVAVYVKDPAAVLDYYVDWTAWLDGDTLTASTWVATGSQAVDLTDAASDPGGLTSIWVSGGLAGENVDLTNHIVTAQGREDERTLRLKVRD